MADGIVSGAIAFPFKRRCIDDAAVCSAANCVAPKVCDPDTLECVTPNAAKPGANGGSATANAAGALADGTQGRGVESPGLRVSDEIAKLCNLPQVGAAPSFDYDSAAIGEQDKDLLSAVARCLSDGALKGRKVSLVGRADRRGEDEYNMALGGSRADSVRRFLAGMGVEDKRINSTSRGELDANGSDEDTWAKDRRVDIELSGVGVQ